MHPAKRLLYGLRFQLSTKTGPKQGLQLLKALTFDSRALQIFT
jgi:hypothetical protein